MKKRIYTYGFILILIALVTQTFAQNGIAYLNDSVYGDALSLRKMDVEADDAENAWIAYYNAGISKYSNGEFTFYNQSNSPIQSNRVNDINVLGDKICFATSAGVARINNNVWEFPGGGLAGYNVDAVFQRPNKIYALVSKDAITDSLAIYNGNNWTFIQIPPYTPSILNNAPMAYIDGHMYWGTREGLYSFNGSTQSIILNNASVNDITSYNGYLWISLNTLTSTGDNIIRYNPENNSFLNFSSHKGFEPTHDTRGACFSVDTDGSLNIIYNHDSQIIINQLNGNNHQLYIYPEQNLSSSRLSASRGYDGTIYHTGWSSIAGFILDKTRHENFQSGFWSRNLKTLDINNVGATVKSYGSMFWDGIGYPHYQVPIDSGTNSIFASGLWVGGYDQSGELHLSAVTYGKTNGSEKPVYDFAPGPLKSDEGNEAFCDTATSNQYDRIWKIDRLDIEQFIYENIDEKLFEIPEDMDDWPGNGPEGFDNLAPFVDYNNDGVYNTDDGDYPQILGDQMLWWINNDNTHPNEETGGNPMGIEMQHSFYGFRYDNPVDEYTELVNYQTYLRVNIVNRSQEQYDSVYIGVWVDADIGNAFDDYVGCDVSRNSFYFYNGDSYDESYQNYLGYGSKPPVQTVTILQGPEADDDGTDNDGDGIVDNENLKMSKFIYYNNSVQGANNATTDPDDAYEYYNYMRGYWKDTTPLLYGGNGHISGGGDPNTPCDYMFPGETDPEGTGTNGVPQEAWSETTENNTPDDRRGICAMGPFTMKPGEKNTIDILFAYIPHDESKFGHFNYQPKLDSLITWYDENRIPSNYTEADALSIQQDNTIHEITVYPNPVNDKCFIEARGKITTIRLYSINGQKVAERHIDNREAILDVRNFSPGLYVLECDIEGSTTRQKISIH